MSPDNLELCYVSDKGFRTLNNKDYPNTQEVDW